MLLENLRRKMWTGRLRRKKKILSFSRPVNVQERIARSAKICICMPDDHKYFYEARDCLKGIPKKGLRITLVLNRKLELLAEHPGETAVYPDPPKKPFPLRESLFNAIPGDFDIAIDLSPQPTAMTAYITGTRGKKLTIGPESGKYDPFYTVLVKTSDRYPASVMTMLSLAGLGPRT
jgi:hypothetical protein